MLSRPQIPIEQTFTRINHPMGDARKRSLEDTWRHVGHLVATIHPTNAPTTSKMPDTLLPKTGTLSASTGYRPASSLLPAKKFHTREMYR